MARSGTPDLDVQRVRRWCAQRVPGNFRHQVRVECDADTGGVIAIAVAPQGGTLYLLRDSTSSRPADLAAVDLATGHLSVVFGRLPGAPVANAMSPDAPIAYVACDSEPRPSSPSTCRQAP